MDDTGAVLSQETGTSPTALYRLLSTAEADCYIDLAAVVPWALRGAPILLTSSDGGYTYNFVDANGTTITATGFVPIYMQKADIPDIPLVEGWDYLVEGTRIRTTRNIPYPFSDGPWVQLINDPIALSATGSPTLPANARLMLVYRAATLFARGGGKRDWRVYDEMYDEEYKAVCMAYHSQVRTQGTNLATDRIGTMYGGWKR